MVMVMVMVVVVVVVVTRKPPLIEPLGPPSTLDHLHVTG